VRVTSRIPFEGLLYDVFETAFGWVAVMASRAGVAGTALPHPTPTEALVALGRQVKNATKDPSRFDEIRERIQAYFAGKRVEFADTLDIRGTDFQRRVWEVTRRIPYGQTNSYRDVARLSGNPLAARAAGQALGANPLPIIIPCHRVLASDGTLGGFGGGLEMKSRLLQMERR
jgi:methylated-DNA-[protein]-cysteine S-methyltransferase